MNNKIDIHKVQDRIAAGAAIVGVAGLVQYVALKVIAARRYMRQPEFVLLYTLTPKHVTWWLFPHRESAPARRAKRLRKARRRGRITGRTLVPATAPQILPESRQTLETQGVPQHRLKQYLKRNSVAAMTVLHKGKLAGSFGNPRQRYSVWSVSKSLTSLVIGALINEGKLDRHSTVSDVLPAFRGQGTFDSITVDDLLDMASGIDLGEHYGFWQRYSGVQGMYLAKSLLAFVQGQTKSSARPGHTSCYRSIDAQVLGLMAEAASGERLADLVSRIVWQPAGAATSALWNLDRRGGREQAFCGCAVTTDDLARVGAWLLAGDTGLGRWAFRISHARQVPDRHGGLTPIEPLEPGWHYSALWWQPPGSDARGDYCARGWRGQYLWIDPRTQTVIAVAANRRTVDADADIAVFRAIADSLA